MSYENISDMTKYNSRLRTYIGWTLSFITPKQMAKAGFYYLGRQDRVRCTFCSIELQYWQRGEDPREEHEKKSPHCAFIRDSNDICGFYGGNLSIDLSLNVDNRKVQEFLLTTGIVHEMIKAKYENFNTLLSRMDSFKIWNRNTKPDIQILCEAGFFYDDDKDDNLTCFCCGQCLNAWTKDDDPWTEHARWSPTCSFLLLSKGKQFVSIASGMNHIPEINQQVLFKMIAINRNAPIQLSPTPRTFTKLITDRVTISEVEDDEGAQLPSGAVQPIVVEPKEYPTIDAAVCKICYKEKLTVVFLPCGHLVACVQCAVTLDHCAICRHPPYLVMKVNIYMEGLIEEYISNQLWQTCDTSPQKKGLNVPADLMLCKMCHEGELGSAFVPCRHVYACSECAKIMDVCPVCSNDVYTTMQVYI